MTITARTSGHHWQVLDLASMPDHIKTLYADLVASYVRASMSDEDVTAFADDQAKLFDAIKAVIPAMRGQEVALAFRRPRLDIALVVKQDSPAKPNLSANQKRRPASSGKQPQHTP